MPRWGPQQESFDFQAWCGAPCAGPLRAWLTTKLRESQDMPEGGGEAFVGDPISKEEAAVHWPSRVSYASQPLTLEQLKDVEDPGKVALFHFREARVFDPHPDTNEKGADPNFSFRLGDCVVIKSSNEVGEDGEWLEYVVRVVEMYVGVDGERWMSVHYFYKPVDTALAVVKDEVKEVREGPEQKVKLLKVKLRQLPESSGSHVGGFGPDSCVSGCVRRLWLASAEDNTAYTTRFSLTTVLRRVEVHKVQPGDACGMRKPGECAARAVALQGPVRGCVMSNGVAYDPDTHYWYNQIHSAKFMTFEDCFEDWAPFSPQYRALAETDGGLAAVAALRCEGTPTRLIRGRNGEHSQDPGFREVRVLDIFAGAGGLSFMCAPDGGGTAADTRMLPRWAVDFNASACATYKVNHPDADVYCTGLDEFVMQLKLIKKDFQRHLGPKWRSAAGQAAGEEDEAAGEGDADAEEPEAGQVEEVVGVRLVDKAQRKSKGSDKGQLEGELKENECQLEYQVKRVGGQQVAWECASNLLDAGRPLRRFLRRLVAQRTYPMPGDADVVAGGPPCQGVSGLNRHAVQADVLADPRNRLVHAYLALVRFLRPRWLVLEQVEGILQKDGGVYARSAVAMFVREGYQMRVGHTKAGTFGCPQGRHRVILFGALSGVEQLPPFPEPTHGMRSVHMGVPGKAKNCQVSIPPQRRAAAHPMVLFGDVLSDLPHVSNFCMSDRQAYKCEPQTPYQLWLRRPPPEGTPSLAARIAAADAQLHSSRVRVEAAWRSAYAAGGPVALGHVAFCRKAANHYSKQVYQAHLAKEEEVAGSAAALRTRSACAMARRNVAFTLGQVMKKELDTAQALPPDAPLRDHRPHMTNADDFLRMAAVPRQKDANYRQLDGVVEHERAGGECCAGSWHAARLPNGASACPGGGCAGKPVRQQGQDGNDKSNRVDNYGTWVGSSMDGCPSYTSLLPTNDLLCPRWCVTYKNGHSRGRHGCFGRVWPDIIQSTVVTRPEPHNLQLVHPSQDRVLTIRENARCQGFPDYYVLVGLEGGPGGHGMSASFISERYKQIGNAVAPPLAMALGRAIREAAHRRAPVAVPLVPLPCEAFDAAMAEAAARGLRHYAVEHNVPVSDRVARVKGEAAASEEAESADDEDEDDDEAPATQAPVAASKGKRKLTARPASRAAPRARVGGAAATAAAAAAAGTSGAGTIAAAAAAPRAGARAPLRPLQQVATARAAAPALLQAAKASAARARKPSAGGGGGGGGAAAAASVKRKRPLASVALPRPAPEPECSSEEEEEECSVQPLAKAPRAAGSAGAGASRKQPAAVSDDGSSSSGSGSGSGSSSSSSSDENDGSSEEEEEEEGQEEPVRPLTQQRAAGSAGGGRARAPQRMRRLADLHATAPARTAGGDGGSSSSGSSGSDSDSEGAADDGGVDEVTRGRSSSSDSGDSDASTEGSSSSEEEESSGDES